MANIDVTAPVIVNEFGEIEDYGLTYFNIVLKMYYYEKVHDWYVGMFLIVTSKCFTNYRI